MQNLSKQLQKLMNRRGTNAQYDHLMRIVLGDKQVRDFLTDHESELDESAVDRGAAKLYEYMVQRGKVERGEVPFAPGFEPTLTVSNHQIDVEYRPTAAKLDADKRRAKKNLVTALNMPKDIAGATLNGYEQTDERMAAILAATDFTVGLRDGKKVTGIYLYGPFGVGKTYLLGAVANELADWNIATTLVHVPTFAVEMKAAIGNNNVLEQVDAIKEAPVLMLDDIGAESFSPWFRDEVLGVILQYRMQEQLPTCFSSNKSMKELRDYLAGIDRGNEEGVKADRIMQRVRYLAAEIELGGASRREQN